jgi:hypothetical protein
MSDLWYEEYTPEAALSSDAHRRYTMPGMGETSAEDVAVDLDSISDWTSLSDAWGAGTFENRATGAPSVRTVEGVESYSSSAGAGAEYSPGGYAPSYAPTGGSGYTTSGSGSFGAGGSGYNTSGGSGGGSGYTTSGGSGYATGGTTGGGSSGYATSGPTSYGPSPAASAASAAWQSYPPQAGTAAATAYATAPGAGLGGYSVGDLYDENRVSCSACNWVLEDKSWCCDRDCNDPNGGDYRQAYVCADPSDTSGRLTSGCEVDTECLADQPPALCSAGLLRERQLGDTRQDPSCAAWRSRTARPRQTDAPAYARQPYSTTGAAYATPPYATQPYATTGAAYATPPYSTQPYATPPYSTTGAAYATTGAAYATQPYATQPYWSPTYVPAATQQYTATPAQPSYWPPAPSAPTAQPSYWTPSPTAPWLGNAS